jgi:two-component system, sensor histidine kinase and response regulator
MRTSTSERVDMGNGDRARWLDLALGDGPDPDWRGPVTRVARSTRRASRGACSGRMTITPPSDRVLLEHMPDALVVVDGTLRVAYRSPSARRVFQGRLDEPDDLRLDALFHTEDAQPVRALVHEALTRPCGTPTATVDLRYLPPTRPPSVLEAVATRVCEDGRPPLVAVMLRDVTESRRVGDELRAAADSAQAASEAKTEFLATMSHEIRTPLAGIIGVADLMFQTGLDEEQRNLARTLTESTGALQAVVTDILDISKIEANQVELESVDFDLHSAVGRLVESLSPSARGRGLELAFVIHADVPRDVRGDTGRFRQILSNLVTNAIKFTPAGEIVVTVSLERPVVDATALVRVEVADTGIGISADEMAGLFERFSQATASISRRFGGTGLGLAISRRFVELMGGQIGAQSVPGEGSMFWFTVRLETPATRQPAARTGVVAGRRVLIVDDVPERGSSRARELAGLDVRGAVIATVEEVPAALAAARQERDPFAVIIVEDSILGMTALRRARRIVTDERTGPVAVVAVTSLGRRGDAARARSAGVAAYLSRPLHPDDLRDTLREVIDPRRDAAAGPLTRHTLAERRDRSGARVLLVEDDPVLQRVLTAMLGRLGCHAEVAGTGGEAVEAASTERYDLILMDYRLPGFDGPTATLRIRAAEPVDRHTVIIGLTASATEADRARCLDAGMDDFLAKPVRLEAIRIMLEEWLPRQVAAGRADASPTEIGTASAAPLPDDLVDIDMFRTVQEMTADEPGDMLGDLIETFASEADRLIASMSAAMALGDGAGLVSAAHRLKGGSSAMGATRVAELAGRLERAGPAAVLSHDPAVLTMLSDAVAGTTAALLQMRDSR